MALHPQIPILGEDQHLTVGLVWDIVAGFVDVVVLGVDLEGCTREDVVVFCVGRDTSVVLLCEIAVVVVLVVPAGFRVVGRDVRLVETLVVVLVGLCVVD